MILSYRQFLAENVAAKLTFVKPIFHLATLFARREAKTRIQQRDWLKLVKFAANK